MSYDAFIDGKAQLTDGDGIEATRIPDKAFAFQADLIEWACRKARAAIFADCGLGKTLMQLAWADNVVRATNRPVLLLTPLAVGHQAVLEAAKFGIEAERSADGKWSGAKVIVTNYERLHYFNREDFAVAVCDESSILKNMEGATRAAVT